ncbi:MAG: PAS domain S-box protein [Sedimentisphaerales bacterium]|nr:PAS domain S-box protein [Sedimentisphaerales bacterium]
MAISELRYRRLFESAKDGILILDAETGKVMDVNPFLADLLGLSRADVLGKKLWELGCFHDIAANENKFAELQAEEYVRYEDLPLETDDGQVREVEFVSNVYLEGGKRVIQCNIRDITTRKRVEAYRDMRQDILEILNESGGANDFIPHVLAMLKSRSGFDAVGIRLRDGDDFPYFVQDGFPEEFLQTENTLIERGRNGDVCRDDEGNVCLECTCGLVLTGRTDPANPLFTRGGSAWTNDSRLLLDIPSGEDPRHHPRNQCVHQGYASVALVPIYSKDRIVGLLQFNDRRKGRFTLEIVEILEELASHIGSALLRAQDEQALMMKTMLLEAQKEASPDGILAVDNDGHTLLFNTRFADIWRIPPNVLDTHDDKAMLEYVSQQLADPEEFKRTVAHLYEHKHEKREDEVLFLDGRCFERYSSPLTDAEGTVRGRIWYFRDITDRKRAAEEEARLSSQLRQAQKMEAVGRLAGGVAHDFNNLLMGIMGYAELCREGIDPDHPVRQHLDEIIQTAEWAAEVTRQLLAFARKQTVAPKVLDLNDTTAGMLKLLRRMIGEDIKLTWRPGADLRPIKIDPSQIDQILANLCVNARDAIAGVGEVVIETQNAVIDAAYCGHHAEALPGRYVCLSVSDDGSGMNKETLAQVFEPFFTTKGIGQGTGLGLATVYGIVKQNNGFMYAYSEPGKGATFKVYLPEVATEAADISIAARMAEPRGRGETILLVEDEKSVRVPCALFLEALGYRVIAAETPGEALKSAAGHSGDLDVLLTDVVMPGMDGRQLAKRISAIKPKVKTLFMSGYTTDVIVQRGVLDDGVHFLSKPFTRTELAGRVREVIDDEFPASDA